MDMIGHVFSYDNFLNFNELTIYLNDLFPSTILTLEASYSAILKTADQDQSHFVL